MVIADGVGSLYRASYWVADNGIFASASLLYRLLLGCGFTYIFVGLACLTLTCTRFPMSYVNKEIIQCMPELIVADDSHCSVTLVE